MRTYEFTLIVERANLLEPNTLSALFEAGCDDATFAERDGLQYATFDRAGHSLEEAIGSAIRTIEETVPGASVMRVEPDELVTPSVIARRTNRSRESIRLLIEGKRGPGEFPPPVAWVDGKTRLWRWSEVARWLSEVLGEQVPQSEDAGFIAALNAALEVRSQSPRLATPTAPLRIAGLLEGGAVSEALALAMQTSKGARTMGDVALELIIRVGTKLLGLIASRAARGFRDTPVERAISLTQEAFPNVVVDTALQAWCQSSGFKELLERITQGKRDVGHQEIVDSFLRDGDFHIPDPEEERRTAAEVITAFLEILEEELYKAEGLVLHARRDEVLHAETKEVLGRMDEGQVALAGHVSALPDELRRIVHDEIEEAVKPAEEPLHARVDEARDLLLEGKALSARQILERLRREVDEEIATAELRFRIATNLGSCALLLGEHALARAEYSKALRARPDDAKALANAAYGELLAGNPDEGLKLARRAHSKDPTSAHATAILLHALQATGSSEELEELAAQTPWVSSDPQCAAALGQIRLQQRRYDEAKELLRASVAGDADNPHIQVQLAVAIVQGTQSALRLDPPLTWRLDEQVRAEFHEAEVALTKAIELLERYEGRELQNDALANRAAVRSMLGLRDGALADCNRALLQDAGHPAALRNRGLLLLDSDPAGAAQTFEMLPETERDASVILNLAKAYGELQEPNKAASLLQGIWQPQTKDRNQIEIAEALIHAYWNMGDGTRAEEVVNSLLANWPDDAEALWIAARQRKRERKPQEAAGLMEEALAYARGNLRDRIALDLADLHSDLGNFGNAADLYETVVGSSAPRAILERYVVSLFNAGRLRDALSLARKLRGGGEPLPIVSEVEALILHRIGDLDEAKRLLLKLAELEPEKVSHRLRAVSMAIERGDSDEASEILGSIRVQEIRSDARALMHMAHARLALGEPDVLPLAYRARRLAYQDSEIHLAYVSAFLNRERQDEALLNPKVVEPDCAVHLTRNEATQIFTIEDDEPDKGRNELSSSDPLAQRLLGTRKGDSVVLEGHDVRYTVAEIQSKYVFAFQDTLSRFPALFPDNLDLRQVPVKDRDVSRIFAMLDEQSRHVERVMEMYRSRPLPLAMVARVLGRSLIDVWIGLTARPQERVKVSTGLATDTDRDRQTISSADSIVLDLTALLASSFLGITEKIFDRFSHVLVVQGVFDEIGGKLADYSGATPSGVMGKIGDRYFMEEISPESLESERRFLEGLRDSIRAQATLVPATGLLELESETYERLDESIGAGALSSILVAKERGAVLYADDLGLRLLGRTEWQVEGTWSQPLLQDLLERKVLNREEYWEALRKLALWNYQFLTVSADDLLGILKQKGLSVDEELTQIFQSLLGPDYAEEYLVQVVAELIKQIWLETVLLNHKLLLLDFILASLVRGRSSDQILTKLKTALRRRLSLIPMAQHVIFEAIDIWSQQDSLRRGLILHR